MSKRRSIPVPFGSPANQEIQGDGPLCYLQVSSTGKSLWARHGNGYDNTAIWIKIYYQIQNNKLTGEKEKIWKLNLGDGVEIDLVLDSELNQFAGRLFFKHVTIFRVGDLYPLYLTSRPIKRIPDHVISSYEKANSAP